MADLPPELEAWFAGRGWRVRRHQAAMLAASDAGRHALLVADTGAGKTLAGFLPTLAAFCPSRGHAPPDGLHTLYVSPLKALAHDVQRNLVTPVEEVGLPLRIETRSGDTPSDRKKRQRSRPPNVLLTTPESLSLLLSYPDSFPMFAGLKRVVIDEVAARLTDSPARVDATDGVRVTTDDGWWLLRASNTQDVLVARAESTSEAGLERLMAQIDEQLALSDLERGEQAGH